jgi:hypothetical protein
VEVGHFQTLSSAIVAAHFGQTWPPSTTTGGV